MWATPGPCKTLTATAARRFLTGENANSIEHSSTLPGTRLLTRAVPAHLTLPSRAKRVFIRISENSPFAGYELSDDRRRTREHIQDAPRGIRDGTKFATTIVPSAGRQPVTLHIELSRDAAAAQ